MASGRCLQRIYGKCTKSPAEFADDGGDEGGVIGRQGLGALVFRGTFSFCHSDIRVVLTSSGGGGGRFSPDGTPGFACNTAEVR